MTPDLSPYHSIELSEIYTNKLKTKPGFQSDVMSVLRTEANVDIISQNGNGLITKGLYT